ncbi:c-type cytochrome biogenesis protein CcmI [soil metagenome]
MVLWIAMAVLAAAACLAVLVPLRRGTAAQSGSAAAIYRDQLDEVERDLARGVVAESEAAAARIEIARRLIHADRQTAPDSGATGSGPARGVATVAVFAAPILALGLYLLLGSPQLPGEPLAARLSAPTQQQDIALLVARVEAHLKQSPDDGKGWEVIAPIYLRLGRSEDAARAFANVIRLLGSTAGREADMGEALVTAARGKVSAEARAAVERATKLDPAAARPRFYLALALGQEGKKDAAIAAWHALLDGAPANPPLVAFARAELARLEAGGATAPGPSSADIAASETMAPAERLAMIEGMVGSLAARLEANPADGEGWARLVRSYMVLGRADDAKAALGRARTALAANAAALDGVNQVAKEAGVPE